MPQSPQSVRCVAFTFSSDALIASMSFGAEQWTGYAARELVGRPITHILADRSAFEFPQILKNAIDWGVWEGDLFIRNRSGAQMHTQGVISSLSGYVHSGFIMTASFGQKCIPGATDLDILMQVGQRLRMMSHEMNNPLAVTMGFLQLIMLNAQCSGKIRTDLEKLHSEISRLVDIVERLHRYAISLQERQDESFLDSLAG